MPTLGPGPAPTPRPPSSATTVLRTLASLIAQAERLDARAYLRLRATLRFDEEVVHEALVDLLEVRRCDHAPCRCALANVGEEDRQPLLTQEAEGDEAALALARLFMRRCWCHQKASIRRSRRGLRPATGVFDDDHVGTSAVENLPDRADAPSQGEKGLTPAEALLQTAAFARVIAHVFSRAACSTRQRNAFVAINVRDAREVGHAVPDALRRAAHVARCKVASYLAQSEIPDRQAFERALEDGRFGARLSQLDAPDWRSFEEALEEECVPEEPGDLAVQRPADPWPGSEAVVRRRHEAYAPNP